MGWNSAKLNGQSELEVIKDFITDNETTYVAHNYNKQEGVYYFALKYKNEVTATIVSMNSFKGIREDDWIYFKVLHEFAEPIYINPSIKVFQALTEMKDGFNYNWRNEVQKLYQILYSLSTFILQQSDNIKLNKINRKALQNNIPKNH